MLIILHKGYKFNELLHNCPIFDFKLFGGTSSDFAIDMKEKELMNFFLVHGVLHEVIETWAIFDHFFKVLEMVFPLFLNKTYFNIEVSLHPFQRQYLLIAILEHPIFLQNAIDDSDRNQYFNDPEDIGLIWA